MEIERLLDELEALGETGERPYTKIIPGLMGKTVINAEQFFRLLRELRTAVPDEVTTATQVTRKREQIVREAQEERAKILEAARGQAQLLISNDELVKQAEQRAEEILAQARIDGDAIRAEAETWARGMVERLENYVSRISVTIDKTKKALVTQTTSVSRGADVRGTVDTDE